VAAHWSYRDGKRSQNPFAVDPSKWIAQLSEQFDAEDNHEDFLEAVKLEMYSDQVFCFTPKGEVVKLPRGATPIDFAYAIHTRIGNACVGAKIDGMRVPLWTRVKNGQSVEVITAEGQTPQTTWLEIATTGKAKTAIRRSLREADRDRFIRLGRELARSAFSHLGKKATDKALATAAKQLRLTDGDEVLARLGSAELTGREVVTAIYPDLTPNEGKAVDASHAVIGLTKGQSFKRASCCEPLPGERIIGITFRGQGVMVHAIDCARLVSFEDHPERWVDLRWHDGSHAAEYGATLEMTIGNDAGVLGRICTLIGETGANISDLHFVDRKPDFYRLLIYVELRDAAHLHAVTRVLEAENEVATIERYRDMSTSEPDGTQTRNT
jgi:GTP pyrophosphokinase/guanosine-3',5'-bis(diphosphate) 3'-pyrophosphohydrolase